MLNITSDSLKLFLALAADAANWSGNPLVSLTAEQRGNLTQLKKAGLLKTFKDGGCEFVQFSADGKQLMEQHGYKYESYYN